MKKFFALAICSLMTLALVVGATHSNAETKVKSSHAVSITAMAAGLMSKPATNRKAGIFKQLQEKYGENRVIADSFIRMEAYLTNGKAEYEFFHRLLGNEAPTEYKLNDQDAFRITDVRVSLLQESTTIPGIGVLQLYPNPIMFPDESGALQTLHLEHIYNGRLVAKIGDTTWLPDFPIADCRVVNTAQQTAAATNRSERGSFDGFLPLVPQYTLKGRENNSLKLAVPANSLQKVESVSGTTGYKTKVVLELRGFKITGAGNTN